MSTHHDLPAELARQLLRYDAEAGYFYWRQRPANLFSDERSCAAWNARYSGKRADSAQDRGYRRVVVFGRGRLAHRLAWLMETGAWPEDEIDHINGDKGDNSFRNLRPATRELNSQNFRRATRRNSSGLMGAHKHSQTGRHSSSINVGGKKVYLGIFETPEEASEAYLAAKRASHPGCTI